MQMTDNPRNVFEFIAGVFVFIFIFITAPLWLLPWFIWRFWREWHYG